MAKASIQPRISRNGTVTYRVMFRHDGKLRSASFPDMPSARRFEREVERFGPEHALDVLGRRTGTHLTSGVPLLREIVDHHIDHLTGVTPGTRAEYRRTAARSFLPKLGELPVDVITRDDVSKWVIWYSEQPNQRGGNIHPKTIKNAHSLLCSVMDTAVHLGHREANPATKMRLPRVERRDHPYLDLDDFARLLDCIDPRFRLFIWTTGATGMRWGEVTALTWRHVHLDDGDARLDVRRAWKKSENGDRVLGVPKSVRSRRTVGIPAALAAELRHARPDNPGPDDLVFPGRGGAALHHSHWPSRYFKPALEEAGIPRTFRFQDLRHSFASWLLNAGVPIWDVSAALGHESVNTTTDRYGHIADRKYQETARTIGALIAGGSKVFIGNDEGRAAIDNVVDGEALPLVDDDED